MNEAMMRHKGYVGVARIDEEAGVIRGEVVNTRDTITFQGRTVAQATRAFRDAVEGYLAFCAERGVAPDRPFSGKFMVRTPPKLHRALVVLAAARGESLNAYVTRVLAKAARPGASLDALTEEETARPSRTESRAAARKAARRTAGKPRRQRPKTAAG